jgi:uncharacterized protein YraI
MRRTALLIVALLIMLPAALTLAQSGVRAVVVNEAVNIRTVPAIGADVIASVPAGYVFEKINARSADGEWIRVDFNGGEGWVNLTPLTVLQGDVAALPVADPRTIPYGGFEAPRSGQTTAVTDKIARVTNGLRVRAGPSQAYPTLANIFANELVMLFGRTESNGWVQVSYEGTLGWVAAPFLEMQNNVVITDLPIDGIVAESPPLDDRTSNDYFDTLRLLLARIDLAQPSLDNIRGKWTDAAITKRAVCRDYPPRPSDYNIPVPLLAQFFNQLDPLQRDFNDAMANLRLAIDLFIEVCNQPGLGNPVGDATIIGALGAVNVADRQFADLRARIRALLPPDREPGPNECLFIFRDQGVILPVVALDTPVRIQLNPRTRSAGLCFDAFVTQNLTIQVLVIKGQSSPLVAVSPFENPTNFIGVGSVIGTSVLQLQVTMPINGRYLLLLNDSQLSVDAELAIAIVQTSATGFTPQLAYNAETDQVTLSTPAVPTATPFFFDPFVTPTPNLLGGNTSIPGGGQGPVVCPSVTFTCSQLFTCQEAYACLAAGAVALDPDGDGVPCPNLCAP